MSEIQKLKRTAAWLLRFVLALEIVLLALFGWWFCNREKEFDVLVLSRHKDEANAAVVSPELMKSLLESIGAKVELPADVGQVEPLLIKNTVVDIRGDKARLGYDATFNGKRLGRELPIHREEVLTAIMREQVASA